MIEQPAAIYGAGGHARVVASILRSRGKGIYGFFDDSFRDDKEVIQGAPVRGKFADILNHRKAFADVYIALGDMEQRRQAFTMLSDNNFALPALVHAQAQVEQDVGLGSASVVCLGALIGAQTQIGSAVIINTGCSVDHETVIGDFTQIAPGVKIAGRTIIGHSTFVGIGACIADRLTIGHNVIIGAGSIILKNVPDGIKVMGIYH